MSDSYELALVRKLILDLAPNPRDHYQDGPDTDLGRALADAIDRVASLEDRINELEDENGDLREQLEFIGDITREKTTKEQKIAAIVQYANNVHEDEARDCVTVLPSMITGLVGVTRRYAYDLVDDIIITYDWAHDPQSIQQHGSLDKTSVQRGVLIDFEGVHGDPVDVNLFTTPTTNEGVVEG